MVSSGHPGDYASLYDDVFQTIADIKKNEADRRLAGNPRLHYGPE